MKKISILIPCYNEELNVEPMAQALTEMFAKDLPNYDYEILFIDNDSKDLTRPKLRKLCENDKHIKAIFNAKNFGQFNSPYYGILQTTGDCVVSMVCDFQDPIELIPQYVHEWENGYKIVIGIKTSSKENKVMYFLRSCYYKLIKKFSDVEQIEHFTGSGLYDKDFVQVLRDLNDPKPFLRGIVAELGYERKEIPYEQPQRRAGKTHLLVAMLLIECLRKPRTTVMYIGETMELSEALVNKAAQDIIEVCHLKNKRGMRFDWKHMDNGSQIIIRGLSNTKDPDQIRGKAAKVIVIDEFFHLKSELLEYMQREVLEPMQMDYADDYMFVCAGTPPRIKGTYGEKVWKTMPVPHFTWTWRDNPHPVSIEAREEFVNKVLEDKGLDWSSSFARREYNGEWAYDDDLLLYPEFHTYNKNESIPGIKPTRILFGIDYGVGDNDTIWGCIWNDEEHRGYQFFEDKFNRLDIMDRSISQLEYLGEQVRYAWRQALDYFPDLSPKEANKRILWDADDSDQHLTDFFNINLRLTGDEYEDLRINIVNAHKTDKVLMYDSIRDMLRRGDMLIIRGGKCEQELVSTILKRGPNGEVYTEIDEKAYHPDLLPAMRYALYNVMNI